METKTNEQRIDLLEQRVANLQEQIQVIASALKNEIQRNQESDEMVGKILENQDKVLKNLVGRK